MPEKREPKLAEAVLPEPEAKGCAEFRLRQGEVLKHRSVAKSDGGGVRKAAS